MNYLFALHGFMGKKNDWDFIPLQNIQKIEIADFPLHNFNSWAKAFNKYTSTNFDGKKILMGYSLGGRLALHCLLNNQNQWDAAIILSTHTGLKNVIERQQRLNNDKNWARLILDKNWDELMIEWESQDVFQHDRNQFERTENDYDRKILAKMLINFSLASQDDLQNKLNELSIPILWLTGEFDKSYCELAEKIHLAHPKSSKKIIPGTGHRFAWSKPELLAETILQFINSL